MVAATQEGEEVAQRSTNRRKSRLYQLERDYASVDRQAWIPFCRRVNQLSSDFLLAESAYRSSDDDYIASLKT